MSPDLDGARAFYGALFGWEFDVGGPEFGGYMMCKVGDRFVAGIGPITQPGHPTVWTTYLATDDIAATAEKIGTAGGTVVAGPMDVASVGTMLIARDSTGGTFAAWQAGEHPGFRLANEPGAVVWNEFLTRDFAGAQRFYADVEGYTYDDMSNEQGNYAMLEVGEDVVGGLGGMPPGVPGQVPPFWNVYFNVTDTDAAVAKVVDLGGTVSAPATDMPYGRFANLVDPQGGAFSVLRLPHQD
jgi:hypothetical protein